MPRRSSLTSREGQVPFAEGVPRTPRGSSTPSPPTVCRAPRVSDVHRRLALVRRPSARLADGIVTHIERSRSVDGELALRQWREYVDVLRRRGWSVVEAPPV